MSVDIKITTNEIKLRAKLKKKEGRIAPQLLVGMKLALEKLRAQEQRDLSAGKFGLKRRSGRLWNSLAIEIRKRGDAVIGLMGTNLPYAPAHEFGATIRPKKSKFLTIPFPGVKGRAREYGNTFFARSKVGNLILFQKTGLTTIKPLFVLKERVKVSKKKWMSRSYKGVKKDLLMILRKSLREAIA